MKRRFASAVVLSFLALVLSTPVYPQATRLPTETELKAFYSIPFVRRDVEVLTVSESQIRTSVEEAAKNPDVPEAKKAESAAALLDFQKYVEDQRRTLDRLRSFVLPRVSTLEASAIEQALKRGEADAMLAASRSTQCGATCFSSATPECPQKCMGEDLLSRMKDCRTARWLPF